jgi:hypothetical protein
VTSPALPDYAPIPRSSLGPALNDQGYYVAASSGTCTGSPMFGSDRTATAAPRIIAVDVRPAARDGQVVQDHPSLPLQPSQQAGGAPLSRRPCRHATASRLGWNRSP